MAKQLTNLVHCLEKNLHVRIASVIPRLSPLRRGSLQCRRKSLEMRLALIAIVWLNTFNGMNENRGR